MDIKMEKNTSPDAFRKQFEESEIGEKDGIKEKLSRMARNNKLAVFSAGVILLFILAAIFAPV